jgi:ankyrin repeat protein
MAIVRGGRVGRFLLLIGAFLVALPALAQSDGTAFDLAAAGRLDRLQKELGREPGLLTARNAQGETLLTVAAAKGQRKVVALLLESKADPDAAASDGGTPLHRAAATGNADTVNLLIVMGANAQAKNNSGRTPGDVARDAGHTTVAHTLDTAFCAAPPAK